MSLSLICFLDYSVAILSIVHVTLTLSTASTARFQNLICSLLCSLLQIAYIFTFLMPENWNQDKLLFCLVNKYM